MQRTSFSCYPCRTLISCLLFVLPSVARATSQQHPGSMNTTSISANVEQHLSAASIMSRVFLASRVFQQPDTKISLRLRDESLESAIHEIARQAKIQVFYENRSATLANRVTVTLKEASLDVALRAVTAGTNIVAKLSPDQKTIMVRTSPPSSSASAQNEAGHIAGQVVDSATRKGIVAATVTTQPLGRSVLTGEKGTYNFRDLPPGEYVVSVKIFGFRTVSRAVTVTTGATATVPIVLTPVPTQLSGVVTTVTGEQRKIEVGNDITTLNVDSITRNMPVSSLTDLLATRVPGLYAAPTTGEPGAPTRIRIRGISSINSTNDPIVVVDGVQIYAEQTARNQGYWGTDRSMNLVDIKSLVPSPLDQIDPNTIQTVEVLKGPSAVALYGSDAANGVIVITTKRGQVSPPRWALDASWAGETMPGRWPTNYFGWGRSLGSQIPSQCQQRDRRLWGCSFDSLVTYQILNDPATTVFGRGLQQTYRGSVTGGVRGITYALTGSASHTVGLMKLPDADIRLLESEGNHVPTWQRRPQTDQQQTGGANVTMDLGSVSTLTFTTLLSRQLTQGTPLREAIGRAALFPPLKVIYDADGIPLPPVSGLLSEIPDFRKRSSSRALRSTNSLDVRTTVRRDLVLQVTGGMDVTSRNDVAALANGDCYIVTFLCTNTGVYNTGQGMAFVTNVNTRVSMPLAWGPWLSLRTSVGANFVRTTINDLMQFASGIPPGATSGNGATEFNGNSRTSDRSTAGMYVETRLGLADRFFLPLAIRKDAGSALGASVAPTFPKLAFSYVVSDQPVFRQLPFSGLIQTLRLRTAYGQAGRQPAVAKALRTYTQSSSVWDGTPVNLIELGGLGNSRLKPERSQEFEGGLDADMLGDRVNLTLSWYRKNTKDLLWDEAVPLSVYGLISTTQLNLGDVDNTGFDLTLGATVLQHRSVTWRSDIILSQQRNKLVRLGRWSSESQGRYAAGGSFQMFVVGYPLYSRWAKPIVAYADRDLDGRITVDEVKLSDSAVYLGAPSPDFSTSISNSMTLFSRITVGTMLSYQHGLTQVMSGPGNTTQYSRANNDPAASLRDQAFLYSVLNSVQTVSTLRFNALSVGYLVPSKITRGVLGSRILRLSVQGTNIGLWTNYRGKDPNVNGGMSEGLEDSGTLPMPRTWGLSVGIN